MKILLTGASGMVGRNLLEHPSAGCYRILTPSSRALDLTSAQAVAAFFQANEPDIVIHCAGLVGGIQANVSRPADFLSINAIIGLNLLRSARAFGVKKFLNLASSCMYPREAENPLRESSLLTGELEPTNEGYALAKLVSTRLAEYIAREDPTLQYRTIIPCNLYGKFDHFENSRSHLIPAVIAKIHQAVRENMDVVQIWGDGTARREFMFAADLADFIFFALSRIDSLPQNINVGLGRDYSIMEYYREVASVIGYRGDFSFDLSKPTGMAQKLVDTTSQRILGWSPASTLTHGLEETYKYFTEEFVDGI